jgi:hypothetical protein
MEVITGVRAVGVALLVPVFEGEIEFAETGTTEIPV